MCSTRARATISWRPSASRAPGATPWHGLAHGSPLALALVAEACADGPVPESLAGAPQVVAELCRLIVDDVPDSDHRRGLATCAHATRMTQDLLARVVGTRADEVWEWLVTRPYVRQGAIGLFLHDVVREAFESELAHRAPDAYTALHHHGPGLLPAAARRPDRAAPRPRGSGDPPAAPPQPPRCDDDHVAPRGDSLGRHGGSLPSERRYWPSSAPGEGPASADLARRWLAEQPSGLYCVRSRDGVTRVLRCTYTCRSWGPWRSTTRSPPRSCARCRKHGAARPGERIHVNRFAGAAGHYQGDPLQLLVNGVACILEWSTRPAAWTFIAPFASELYGPYFEYLGMAPIVRELVDGHEVVGYGWDRRRFPIPAFFEMAARRELTGETGPPPPELLRPSSRCPAAISMSPFVPHCSSSTARTGSLALPYSAPHWLTPAGWATPVTG